MILQGRGKSRDQVETAEKARGIKGLADRRRQAGGMWVCQQETAKRGGLAGWGALRDIKGQAERRAFKPL